MRMPTIYQLSQNEPVSQLLKEFKQTLSEGLDLAVAIQQIPAPTFAENERADFVAQRFGELGLTNVSQDGVVNVYGLLAGNEPQLPPVIVSAHTDTVFGKDVDLTIRREKSKIYGPGIGDNSMGVAALIWLAKVLKKADIKPTRNVWFVANSCEEGLGDLKGMQAAAQRFGKTGTYIVIEGGSFGHLIYKGIGVKRYRITVSAKGGHSWADFGRVSAIHILGKLIAALDQLVVPKIPKTTYNVGVISGGTSINSIAQSAELLLDLRSEEINELEILSSKVEKIIKKVAASEPAIHISQEEIGNRPAGELRKDHPLIKMASDALKVVQSAKVELGASSTDANIPLAMGAEAICIGIGTAGNVHRVEEFLDTTNIPKGMGQLLLLTLGAAGIADTGKR